MESPRKQSVFKKTVLAVLVFSIIFSSSFFVLPKKSEAQNATVIVGGIGTVQETISAWADGITSVMTGSLNTKFYVLDPLAGMIRKAILRKMTGSIINWINTGFQGKPSFLTDPNAFFRNIAKEQTNIYIIKLVGEQTNNPYALDLAYSLLNPSKGNFTLYDDMARNCQLRGGGNSCPPDLSTPYAREAYARQFIYGNVWGPGGWSNWYSLTQYNKNNIYGAYLQAQNELAQRKARETGNAQQELQQSGGFLSFKKCVRRVSYATGPAIATQADVDDNSNLNIGDNIGECAQWEIQTPGKAAADYLSSSLTSDMRQSEMAKDFWESVGAIVEAFVNQVTFMGVKSLSDTAAGIVSGGGGQPNYNFGSFTSQLINPTSPTFADKPTPGIPSAKDTILGKISEAKTNETNYKNVKIKSLKIVTDTESSLINLKNCYVSLRGNMEHDAFGKNGVIWVDTTIREQVTAVKSRLNTDVTSSLSLITQIDEFSQKTGGVNTPTELLTLSQDFSALTSGNGQIFHDAPSVIRAEQIEQPEIQTVATTLMAEIETRGDTCRANGGILPTTTSNTSGTGIANNACGTANGVARTSAPTNNLCPVENTTPGNVAGNGPWTWTCTNRSSSLVTACSAPFLPSTIKQVFTSSGSWTIPAGITKIKVWVIGGGGGGAGAGNTEDTAGGGGGAGGVVYKTFDVTPGLSRTITYTIGNAGMAGLGEGASGLGGNPTTVSYNGTIVLTANGGTGGRYNRDEQAIGGDGSGGDTSAIRGGLGANARGDVGGGGWGAIGGSSGSLGATNGGAGGRIIDVSGLVAALTSAGYIPLPNAPGGLQPVPFGNGGNGAGKSGGNGTSASFGGGGGGAAGFSLTGPVGSSFPSGMVAGGDGGKGAVVITSQI